MLRFSSFEMHQPTKVLQLADLLTLVPENGLEWSVVDFHGVGRAPEGLAMPVFEERVRSSALGYRMSWTELTEFASSLEQTMECVVVAAISIDRLSKADLDADDFSKCSVVIEARDSTEWRIGIANDVGTTTTRLIDGTSDSREQGR